MKFDWALKKNIKLNSLRTKIKKLILDETRDVKLNFN